MRICPHCKKEYDNSWKVCLKCGIPLEDGLEARLTNLENQAKKILNEIEAIRKGDVSLLVSPDLAGQNKTRNIQAATSDSAIKEDAETRIGKYLLNKIGIISVVAGVAFFLSYAFKYLSPLWRICIGYIISATMTMSGIIIEKVQKYKWYGRGLICGGWVLAYFTTYAMYHIKTTRIISNQFTDLMLVSIVVFFMVSHLLKYRSQSLVILAMLLGYITAGISLYASFAFLYITILAAVSGILLVRMNWQGVAAFSLLGTYITHLVWIRAYEHVRQGTVEFWISIGFLAAYWTIYNIVSFFVKADSVKKRSSLNGFILVNSLLFGLLCFMEVSAYNSSWKSPFALTAAGIVLALAAISKYTKNKEHIKTAYFVASITFVTASLRFSLGKDLAYFVWFCEIPILLLTGLYIKNVLYKVAAWGLSFIMAVAMMVLFGMPETKIIFIDKEMYLTLFLYLVGIICFYLARYVYIDRPGSSRWDAKELDLSNSYTIIASIVLLGVSYYEIQTKLVTLTWAVSALFLFVIGFFLKDKFFRYSAIGLVAASLLRGITVDLAGVNTAYRIIVFVCLGLVLLAVSFWYTKISVTSRARDAIERTGLKITAVVLVLLLSIWVLAIAYLYPSEFRKEDKLKGKEIEITARFITGKNLSNDEMVFLRDRKFKTLEQTLRSLPLQKDGHNLDIYIRAMDAGLRSKEIYNKLGWYYSERGEKGKAIDAYEKGIVLDAEIRQWDTRYMVRSVAKLYKAVGNYKNAATYYEKYLTFSKNVEDLYELAICYERLGEFDKALEKVNEALRMDQGGQYSEEIKSLRSDIYSKKEMLEVK